MSQDTCPNGGTLSHDASGVPICTVCPDDSPCIATCPNGFETILDESNVVTCSWFCPNQAIWLHPEDVYSCVNYCPDGWILSSDYYGQSICHPRCSGENDKYFGPLNTCYATCPDGTTPTTINEVTFCQRSCPDGSVPSVDEFGAPNCVESTCFGGYLSYDSGVPICHICYDDIDCTATCPQGFATIPQELNGVKCYWLCPGQAFWIHPDFIYECLNTCPDGWISDSNYYGQSFCNPRCSGEKDKYFAASNTCYAACPDGTAPIDMNDITFCQPSCPDGYVASTNDVGAPTCVKSTGSRICKLRSRST